MEERLCEPIQIQNAPFDDELNVVTGEPTTVNEKVDDMPTPPILQNLDQSAESVLVGTTPGASISLYRNGVLTAEANATSASIRLALPLGVRPGDVMTATQSVGGQTSPPSAPVTVELNYVTHHFDRERTGWNPYETALSVTSVETNFHFLFAQPVDGQVYAQPLYVQNVVFPWIRHPQRETGGGHEVPGPIVRNVLYVATENDSVYAFDADIQEPALAYRSLVPAGERVVYTEDFPDCVNLWPYIGITATPVIDRTTNTLFVTAKTTDGTSFHWRLYALDLVTLRDQQPPVEIEASVEGHGRGNVAGTISFDPYWHLNRPGLLLSQGVLYVAFGSHCDKGTYHGWLMAYDAASLRLLDAFNTSPDRPPDQFAGNNADGRDAAIWMSGFGPAADADGNIYFATGNGSFGGRDYGCSVLKLHQDERLIVPPGRGKPVLVPYLRVVDSYTPSNQQVLNNSDKDLGSGGVMLVPPQPRVGPRPPLPKPPPPAPWLVACGKEGKIYLLDSGSLGGFGDSGLLQYPPQTVAGIWGGPSYFRGPTGQFVYYCGGDDQGGGGPLTSFALDANGLSGRKESAETFPGPFHDLWPQVPWPHPFQSAAGGAIPTVSSNGSAAGSGVVWIVRRRDPMTLFAYDAADVTKPPLFTGVAGHWHNDQGSPFVVPTVVNGKVYVGTGGPAFNDGQVAFFGLRVLHPPV